MKKILRIALMLVLLLLIGFAVMISTSYNTIVPAKAETLEVLAEEPEESVEEDASQECSHSLNGEIIDCSKLYSVEEIEALGCLPCEGFEGELAYFICDTCQEDVFLSILQDVVEPEQPVEPETPVEPEQPVEPETPVEPEQPVEPETPVEPEQPVEPETPVEPEQPVEPETPVEPEQPVEPETPVEPEQPVEPNSDIKLGDKIFSNLGLSSLVEKYGADKIQTANIYVAVILAFLEGLLIAKYLKFKAKKDPTFRKRKKPSKEFRAAAKGQPHPSEVKHRLRF